MGHNLVFLFDVDNTLLDNDRVAADLKQHLEKEVGHERQQRYWEFFEELRAELGYADYLGALQRYRSEYPRDPNVLTVSEFGKRFSATKSWFMRVKPMEDFSVAKLRERNLPQNSREASQQI